ncbi:hypothetical protein LLE49_10175 [Alicyclobacillus tolerans]|uniref:hypothetical protein n=1 Tax=Alicyclobacillus tolerans TaxID=90970 RepID=UPI001F28D6A3|nr:hypothetical protein [Alicyclobacillus tolerans]MCF8565080.1 hypothetical protein [Alicyclobacillus tolerans]
MYGTNPLVPLTGFGAPAGAAILAGYPLVAIGITVVGAFITASLLWKSRSRSKTNTF